MSNAESAWGSALHGTEPGEHRTAVRWARPLLFALMGACVLLLLARFVGEPLTRIRHVTVHSDVPLSDEEVLALSGIQSGDHWYSVSEAAIEKRLETSPIVRRAQVQRVFPDTVRMTVWGRQPAALVLATRDGRTVPVLVDEDGVVYRVGATGADMDLPVVSGVSAGEVSLGSALPPATRKLFSDLRALRDHAPSLYAQVSEVRIAPNVDARADSAIAGGSLAPDAPAAVESPRDVEMLVYLTSARVPIRARGTIDESLVKYALMVIDLLSRQGVLQDIQELDFRSGDVVYRLGSAARDGVRAERAAGPGGPAVLASARAPTAAPVASPAGVPPVSPPASDASNPAAEPSAPAAGAEGGMSR